MAPLPVKERMQRRTHRLFIVFLWGTGVGWSVLALQKPSKLSRRTLIESSVLLGSSSLFPDPAVAKAKGAAELDFEYYMRDLLVGNKKEGAVKASAPPKMPPPRTLQGPLLPFLLDDDCRDCIPVLALQITRPKVTKEEISQQVEQYRTKANRSFYARAPWNNTHVSDQYYFDLTSYALWRTAADILTDYVERDRFVRTVGRLLYSQLQTLGLASTPQPGKLTFESCYPVMVEILQAFQSSQFCKRYRIGTDEQQQQDLPIFDEFDDESLDKGGSVDCLVSLYEPASLGASLQITGEQSRFSPDYVGATLAAMWEAWGISSTWETFFVDPEYRPNPKDYFPNEQLLQFTLTRKS